jgi:hypothetical protein
MELLDEATAIRATMKRSADRIAGYNWFQAADKAGAAPHVAEMMRYGVVTAEAYRLEGLGVTEAITAGVKGMASWAQSEVKGTTSRASTFKDEEGLTYSPTMLPSVDFREDEVEMLEYGAVDVWDQLANLNTLDDIDRQVLALRAYGYELAEIGEAVGLSKSGAYVRLGRAQEKAREEWR